MKTTELLGWTAFFSLGVLACGSGSSREPGPTGTAGSAAVPSLPAAGSGPGPAAGGSGMGGAGAGGTGSPSGAGGAGGAVVTAGAASGGAGSAGVVPLSCDDHPVPAVSDQVVGWAAVAGDGVDSTSGGLGGDEVTAESAEQLAGYAASAPPLVIRISKSLDIGTLDVVSNKTLLGVGPQVTLRGGIRVRPLESGDPAVTNVVIRNLRVDASASSPDDGGDGIHIERAHHVWVDHCEVFDAPDGNLDVTHGSNWITVSWTKFHYTAAAPKQDHRFSNLIGHSENSGDTDRGRLKVTYHHVFWSTGVEQRMPRVRFGQVHVFNNYVNAPGAQATVAAGTEAQLLVENNHFQGVKDPHFFHEGSTTAQIAATGNVYVATSGKRDVGQGASFAAPYPYVLDAVEGVPCDVSLGAGPR